MRLSLGPAALAVAALAALAAAADPPAKTAAKDVAGRAPVSASLLGAGWGLVNANGSVSLDDITMPTHALAALEDAKVIGDPLYRYEDEEGSGSGAVGVVGREKSGPRARMRSRGRRRKQNRVSSLSGKPTRQRSLPTHLCGWEEMLHAAA